MSSSLISGSGSTSSGGVLYSANNAVQTPTSTENTITLENEIFYTGIPVVTSYPSHNGSVTLYTSPVLVSSSEETISIPTLLQEHHRDYYKGESFRYSPEWRQNYHYRHDEYITDFISITPTTLLYCKNSHLSAIRPELTYDSEGNVTGVDSDDWGISITVRDGRTLTWDDYTEEQKQELIDDVLDSFNYSCIYVGSGRIYGEPEVPTVFPYSPIEYAQVNDVYINTQNSGLYTCVTPGEPDEAEWIYQGSIKGAEGPEGKVGPRGPKGDTGNRGEIWVTGTELTGTSINNKTIRGAQKGDLYLNSETGLVYRCTRDEIDASIVGTELLNESFATIVSNQPLTDYDYGGTITYQDEYINYVTSSSNTKGMSEALSGGTRPEVLFAKNSIIDIEDIPTAGATSLLLSFKSNNYSRVEVPDTDYYTVSPGEGEGQYILELSDIYSYITITLENNTNSNARIDDIIVNVKSSGENTPQVWEYVTSLIATPSVSGMTIVELSSPTGELTDEQFELVSSDHCIVKYNGYYYFKTYQSPEGGDYRRLTTSKTDNAITSYYFTFDTEYKEWTFGTEVDNRQRIYPNTTIPSGTTPVTLTTIGIGSTKYLLPQGSPDAVKYTSQNLTEQEKAQARANIGAASDASDYIIECGEGV